MLEEKEITAFRFQPSLTYEDMCIFLLNRNKPVAYRMVTYARESDEHYLWWASLDAMYRRYG